MNPTRPMIRRVDRARSKLRWGASAVILLVLGPLGCGSDSADVPTGPAPAPPNKVPATTAPPSTGSKVPPAKQVRNIKERVQNPGG